MEEASEDEVEGSRFIGFASPSRSSHLIGSILKSPVSQLSLLLLLPPRSRLIQTDDPRSDGVLFTDSVVSAASLCDLTRWRRMAVLLKWRRRRRMRRSSRRSAGGSFLAFGTESSGGTGMISKSGCSTSPRRRLLCSLG